MIPLPLRRPVVRFEPKQPGFWTEDGPNGWGEPLGRQSAVTEARLLYRMIGPENTVEELRELIAVPTKIESVLRA